MSGSQHNPNGRQSQLGSGWSPLQVLQMANLLARAPQAHMASDRGVTWHTPTPPPHLYHVPAPSPPDPLQAMKNAGSNSVFRHTATPPELYRHTPTPPDKHMMRHTPSPGDVTKAGPPVPPVDLYPHLGPGRDKMVRAEELLAYARGVDLSLGSRANGAPAPPLGHSPALSVRDAPTINSLISRGSARRVDSLLERLGASGGAPCAASVSPHSVIVHPRATHTPSPPSSNEDSGDSFGAAPGSKRKRKPERTVRLPVPPPPAPLLPPPVHHETHQPPPSPTKPTSPARLSPPRAENGHPPPPASLPPPAPAPSPPRHELRTPDHSTRRKTRSGSAETIADIAAMIAGGGAMAAESGPAATAPAPLSVDKLKSVLASPEPEERAPEPTPDPTDTPQPNPPESSPSSRGRAGAPTPARTRGGGARSPSGAVRSPSEARAADGAAAAEPAAAFVEVENQLEKMFAGLEEDPRPASDREDPSVKDSAPPSKRRKSAPGRGRGGREAPPRRKGPRKKPVNKRRAKEPREGYDSGSNASSGRSRGPYIQIRGPRASPMSVCVMNATTGEEEETVVRRRTTERRRGLHASTLGLRYDAATRDLTWLCAFCGRAPHAASLGDLFGPYVLDTDLAEYRALDDSSRRVFATDGGRHEAWLHADCAVWAPGVVAAGARVWGLPRAVWAAAAERCLLCSRHGAPIACAARNCTARAHLPCARAATWRLDEADFRALCPAHCD